MFSVLRGVILNSQFILFIIHTVNIALCALSINDEALIMHKFIVSEFNGEQTT